MGSRIINSRLLPVFTLCLFGCSILAAVPDLNLPAELSDKGYLRAGDEERVRIELEDQHGHFVIGTKVPLIQKNPSCFVGLIEGEYTDTRIFSVPRVTGDNQGTAWVTQENNLIFGRAANTSRGFFYFQLGEWLTILEEDEENYTVLCTRFDKTFTIDVPKDSEGIEFLAELPQEVGRQVMERNHFRRRPAHPSPVINDEFLREMRAGEPIMLGTPVKRTSESSAVAMASANPKPAPTVAAEAAKKQERPRVREAPAKKIGGVSKWLMKNTSWAQPSDKDDPTRVITPESIDLALHVNEPDAAAEDNVSKNDPAATTLTRVEEDETAVEAVVTTEIPTTSPLQSEPEPESQIAGPIDMDPVGTVPNTDLAQADPEPALDTAPEEHVAAPAAIEVAVTPEEEAVAVAVAKMMPWATEASETTAATTVLQVLVFLAAVMAGVGALIMGMAWFLNRGKKKEQETEEATETPATEEMDEPAAAPPPLPEGLTETPPELEEEFSKKMSFSGGVFTGSLDGLTVTQLVQFIHSVEESGSLSVAHGSGQKAGKVFFKKGEISDVRCEDLRAEEALREVIKFQDGIFAFSRQPVDSLPETAIEEGTMSLLMNALKTLDEDQEEEEEAPAEEVSVAEVS